MVRTVHGENSVHLATPEADLDVTLRGGHLAPVVFHLPGRDVSPYALAPWEPSEYPELPPLLSVLRGDFFCLPFGGQLHGPPHGCPANADWSLTDRGDRSLEFVMEAADSGARIEKVIKTNVGHHAIYAEHRISNLEGEWSYGMHPILNLSGLPEGAGRISTSPFRWASVFPGVFSDPAAGETQALAAGARFSDLCEVPLAAGGTTDLTRYPSRLGNDDLVMMVNEPASQEQPFAWSAAVLDGYLWFCLKDPADFPATMLWLSNGGRTAPPWDARHIGRIGIEEVCSYFSNGVALSRENPLAEDGIPTIRRFNPGETVSLKIIQGVALIPKDFGRVRQILPDGRQSVLVHDEFDQTIRIPADWRFVSDW